MNVWLVFEFENEKYIYNMSYYDIASICDDLATDLTERVPLYWYDHKKKQYVPVSIFTNVEK